jgi:hypothetical protein
MRGAPLATDQWLGQLLLYAGYAAGSWHGVLAVRTIAVAVLVACIAAAALVRRPGPPAVALAIAVPAILLSRFIWTERPELFGVASFAALVLLLQLRGRVPLYVAAALVVAWANVHGSFALGAGLLLLVAAHGLVSDPPQRRAFAVAAAGALLSTMLTPAGVGTLAAPGIHLSDPPRQIQEWALPDPTTPAGAMWAALLGLVIFSASLSHPARARDVILVVPVALLSLLAIRHMPLFAIAVTPYLAEHLPRAARALAMRLGMTGAPSDAEHPRVARPWLDLALACTGAALLVGGIAVAPRDASEPGPRAALAELPAGPGVLAQYDWGGWLIWNAPATPVFVDGRLVPYRGAVLADHDVVIEARPGWREVLERRAVRWILVRPTAPVAVRARQLGWRTTGDASYVLIAVPQQ